jgi:hypothetical protein
MAFNLDEDRYAVNDVARRVGVHTATVWRWILTGVRGQRLRSYTVGGRRYVLRRDLETFLSPDDESANVSPGDRERRADDAGKLLDRHGLRPR